MKCTSCGKEMDNHPWIEGAFYCLDCWIADYPWDDEPKQSVFDFIRGLFDIKRR